MEISTYRESNEKKTNKNLKFKPSLTPIRIWQIKIGGKISLGGKQRKLNLYLKFYKIYAKEKEIFSNFPLFQ